MILLRKSVFLSDIASLRWLNNVTGVYLVQVLKQAASQSTFINAQLKSPCD